MDWILITRYLNHTCSAAERRAVRAWADADPANAEALEAAGQIWESVGVLPESWDVAAGWREVAQRLVAPASANQARSTMRRRRFFVASDAGAALRRTAIAAGLLAAVGLGAVADRFRGGASHGAVAREFSTAPGQRLTLTLADGSIVTLAPASRLRLAPDYGADQRNVTVDGEAAFAVVHDARRPFHVHAGRTVATDVGTRFDVRAYAGDTDVRVVVAEGAVALAGRATPMGAGDLAVIDADGRVRRVDRVDATGYLSWTSGRLAFDDTPIASAAIELARWYGTPVVVSSAVLRRRSITITLEPQSLESALTLIGAAIGARVEHRGSAYALVPAVRTEGQ